ncbi:hypothetical protein F5879DRAFT_995569 [Lentinula edodes]|nr:hypothetical protein F5879DRAFT_995569 [Lentinula edodes]
MPAFKYNVAYNPIGTTLIAFPSLESVDDELLRALHQTSNGSHNPAILSMNESKQAPSSSLPPNQNHVASTQHAPHAPSLRSEGVEAESSFVQETNAFRVALQHHAQHMFDRGSLELDGFRIHQSRDANHEGRTVAINNIKAAGIAHVLGSNYPEHFDDGYIDLLISRADQGSAWNDEAQAKTTRSTHPGAGPLAFHTPPSSLEYDVDPYALPRSRKVKNKDIWTHWFMFRTDQDIDYPPLRPARFPTLEDHTLFIHVNTKTQQKLQTISLETNGAPGGPPIISRCLQIWIWKAGDHEWRTIQYGDAEVIGGESLVLSLCKGGLEPCWVLASSLRKKGYKFLLQKTTHVP